MVIFRTITTDKKQYLPFLLLADSCGAMINRYLEAGDVYAFSVGDAPVCVVMVVPYSDMACEFKNLVTDPQFQRQGYATRLMETLFKFYAVCFRATYVGVASPGAAFYARFGFTYTHTVTGFSIDNYSEPIYEDGVLPTDVLYLKKELA